MSSTKKLKIPNSDNRDFKSTLNNILFFKVWRNLYLKTKIISFLPIVINIKTNNKINISFKYDSIVDSYWMLKNGYTKLLFDKVYKSEYITFKTYTFELDSNNNNNNNDNNDNNDNDNKYTIFNQINENNIPDNYNIQLFYNSLFYNYSRYFKTNSIIFNETISMILESDNIIALKSFIFNYNYKPTIEYFLDSIGYCKFNISNYILENCNLELNGINLREIGKSKQIINGKLSNLYQTCIYISKLSKQFEKYISELKRGHIMQLVGGGYTTCQLSKYLKKIKIITINKLEKMNFTTSELDSNVYTFKQSDKRVEQLVAMIIPFDSEIRENLTFYSFKYQRTLLPSKLLHQGISRLEFGILNYNNTNSDSDITGDIKQFHSQSIFKSIPNEISRHYQFIKEYIKTNLKQSTDLFRMLMVYDNIKYLEYLFSHININYGSVGVRSDDSIYLPYNFIDYINSISMFDYILKLVPINYILENNFYNIISALIRLDKIEILIHYRNNYNEYFQQSLSRVKFNNHSVPFNSFKYINENRDLFQSSYFDTIKYLHFNGIQSFYQLNYYLNNTPQSLKYSIYEILNIRLGHGKSESFFTKESLLIWLIQNRSNDIIVNEEMEQRCLFNSIDYDDEDILFSVIQDYSIRNNDYNWINLNCLNVLLYIKFIERAIHFGQISIVKYLFTNYANIFNIDSSITTKFIQFSINLKNIDLLSYLVLDLHLTNKINFKSFSKVQIEFYNSLFK